MELVVHSVCIREYVCVALMVEITILFSKMCACAGLELEKMFIQTARCYHQDQLLFNSLDITLSRRQLLKYLAIHVNA